MTSLISPLSSISSIFSLTFFRKSRSVSSSLTLSIPRSTVVVLLIVHPFLKCYSSTYFSFSSLNIEMSSLFLIKFHICSSLYFFELLYSYFSSVFTEKFKYKNRKSLFYSYRLLLNNASFDLICSIYF